MMKSITSLQAILILTELTDFHLMSMVSKSAPFISQYNDLVYSVTGIGGYCKYCVLFGRAAYSMSSFTGVLIDRPLTNLQKASQKLRDHFQGVNTESVKKKSFRSSPTG